MTAAAGPLARLVGLLRARRPVLTEPPPVVVLDPVDAHRVRAALVQAERVAGIDMSAPWVVELLRIAGDLGAELAQPPATPGGLLSGAVVEEAAVEAARVLQMPLTYGLRCALVDLADAVTLRAGLESGAADPLASFDDWGGGPGALEAALLQADRDEFDALWRLSRGGVAA